MEFTQIYIKCNNSNYEKIDSIKETEKSLFRNMRRKVYKEEELVALMRGGTNFMKKRITYIKATVAGFLAGIILSLIELILIEVMLKESAFATDDVAILFPGKVIGSIGCHFVYLFHGHGPEIVFIIFAIYPFICAIIGYLIVLLANICSENLRNAIKKISFFGFIALVIIVFIIVSLIDYWIFSMSYQN